MGGTEEERTLPVIQGLMAGAVAGLCSRAVVYPADTLKSQLQLRGALQPAASHPSAASATARPSTLAAFAQVCEPYRVPCPADRRLANAQDGRT